MEKEKCFYVENKYVYLEQVLVEYNGIPIFFICSSDNDYFIALCTDIENYNYILVMASQTEIYNMFNEKIAMRDIILNQREYWKIISGDEICNDDVKKYSIEKIDLSVLPEASAYYKVLTDEVRQYVKKFESDYLNSQFFGIGSIMEIKRYKIDCKSDKTIYSRYVEFLDCSIKISEPEKEYQYEYITEDQGDMFKNNKVKIQNNEIMELWKNDERIYAA